MKKYIFFLCALFFYTEITAQTNLPENPILYEVNLRHHTSEGTLQAFIPEIKRLKALGVNILWVMPAQPIGKKKRKAKGDVFVEDIQDMDEVNKWNFYKGSPYAIANYTAVNPDYGTLSDFRTLVKECHKEGILVILDWVANHTAWDHDWITQHPEWYLKNSLGEITDPLDKQGKSMGWTDVAKLNYQSKELRAAMITSMKFWIDSVDLDGFRCDVAMDVPVDFWNEATTALRKIKPIFMLAESEEHDMEQFKSAFNAYYGWEVHHVLNHIAQGSADAKKLGKILVAKAKRFPHSVFPMNFITNHDENAWNGTEYERLGNAWKAMAVFTYFTPGIPLLYTGQELGNQKRLAFFETDQIVAASNAKEVFKFYEALGQIKHRYPALLGVYEGACKSLTYQVEDGGILVWVRSDLRKKKVPQKRLCIAVNMTSKEIKWRKPPKGNFVLSSEEKADYLIGPWGFRIVEMELK